MDEEEYKLIDPFDVAAMNEAAARFTRRANRLNEFVRSARIAFSAALPPTSLLPLRQPLTEQELLEGSEAGADDFDVRDAPELAAYAERLGYQHGYEGKPLRFALFAAVMLRQHGPAYPGLEPGYYETYYVAGHRRGEEDAVQLYQYALDHGETRAPGAPVMAEHPPSP